MSSDMVSGELVLGSVIILRSEDRRSAARRQRRGGPAHF
jgi:hypothetical protein